MKNMLLTRMRVLLISSLIFLCFGFNITNAASGTLADGLTAEFLFNGNLSDSNTSATFILDSYSSSRFGYVDDQNGITNGAVYTISSNYLETNSYSIFPIGDSSRSFSFWGKIDNASSSVLYPFTYGGNDTNQAFTLMIYNSKFMFSFGGNIIETNVPIDWNNWHHYSITYDSNSSTLKFYIDGALKFTNILGFDLATSISSSYKPKLGYSIGYTAGDFLIHNRALTSLEVRSFTNIVPVITSITSNGNILAHNETNYEISLNGINEVNNDIITFEYSFDNITYYSMSGSLQGPISDGTFTDNLDFSSFPEGAITIYAKVTDGMGYSNIVSMIVQKNTAIPIITTASTIDNNDIKSLRFTMNTDLGVSTQSIINSSICDSTLTFTDYSEVVFDLSSDNGKYVCYKVDLGQGNIHYKLSEKVSGVLGKMTYTRGSMFGSYLDWRKSNKVKDIDTTYAFLNMMVSTTEISTTNIDKSYPSSLVDINGDGLVDMLYTNYSYNFNYSTKSWISKYKYAILVNNGDYTFTPTYRCVKEGNTYYGNCADITNY